MSDLIETQKYTSYEDVSKSNKQGLTYINYIPDGSTTVRFLSEPVDWIQYPEWYDKDNKKSYPVLRSAEIEIPDDARIAKRFLAPVLLVDDDEVVTMKLPKTAVEQLFVSYDRNGTVMDRDFDIIRSGERLKTTYQIYAGEKMKRPLNKYDAPDVSEVLDNWARETLAEFKGETLEEVDEKPKKPKTKEFKRNTEEPEFTTKQEQHEYRLMLQEMIEEDEDALGSMEVDELKEHLSMFGKTSRSQNTAVLIRMLKKEIQS